MTNEQFGAGLIAFLIGNATMVWAIGKWGISKAIAYTHLERDVRELMVRANTADQRYEKVMNDLKGLSGKIVREIEAVRGENGKSI